MISIIDIVGFLKIDKFVFSGINNVIIVLKSLKLLSAILLELIKKWSENNSINVFLPTNIILFNRFDKSVPRLAITWEVFINK